MWLGTPLTAAPSDWLYWMISSRVWKWRLPRVKIIQPSWLSFHQHLTACAQVVLTCKHMHVITFRRVIAFDPHFIIHDRI